MTSIRSVHDIARQGRGGSNRLGSMIAFTLIELLIVLTLIGILSASITVSIHGAQDSQALRTAGDDLMAAISFGFEESRLKSVAHRIAFAGDGASYRLEVATGDIAQPYRPVGGMAGVSRHLAAGVQIASIVPLGIQSTDGMCSELLCVSPGGFDGTITLRNRRGETIMLEVLAGTGQVNVAK